MSTVPSHNIIVRSDSVQYFYRLPCVCVVGFTRTSEDLQRTWKETYIKKTRKNPRTAQLIRSILSNQPVVMSELPIAWRLTTNLKREIHRRNPQDATTAQLISRHFYTSILCRLKTNLKKDIYWGDSQDATIAQPTSQQCWVTTGRYLLSVTN